MKKAAQEVKRVVKKAVKPVYKQTKTTDAQAERHTRRYRNPITGSKKKVVKTQGGNKRVQVDKRQEGVGKRRVVKQKVKSGDTNKKERLTTTENTFKKKKK